MWLFSPSPIVGALWLVLKYETKTFAGCAHSDVYPRGFTPEFLLPDLSILFLFRPLPARQAVCHCSWACTYIPTPKHFSFHKRWTVRWTAWNSTHWENFPSLLSFLASLEWDYNAIAIHFWFYAHLPSWPIFKPSLGFLKISWSHGTPNMAIGHRERRWCKCGRWHWDLGYYFIQLAGTLWFSLHSVSDVALPSYDGLFLDSPDLTTDWSDRTRLIVGNSRCMVTRCPTVR